MPQKKKKTSYISILRGVYINYKLTKYHAYVLLVLLLLCLASLQPHLSPLLHLLFQLQYSHDDLQQRLGALLCF